MSVLSAAQSTNPRFAQAESLIKEVYRAFIDAYGNYQKRRELARKAQELRRQLQIRKEKAFQWFREVARAFADDCRVALTKRSACQLQ